MSWQNYAQRIAELKASESEHKWAEEELRRSKEKYYRTNLDICPKL